MTDEDNAKGTGVGKKMEEVHLLVSREDVEQMLSDRIERASKRDLARQGQMLLALTCIQAAKALLSVTSKEKAKEALRKAVSDAAAMQGRAAAEQYGSPKDLDSFVEARFIKDLGRFPFIPPGEFSERTPEKIICGIQNCMFADCIRELATQFPNWVDRDTLEVATGRCDGLDEGWARGWDPDMLFKRTHFKLADLIGGPPSKGCYFECRMK